MDFIDQIKQFSKRVSGMKDSLQTEEATKTALVLPFFSLLGYDVFNPEEFVPEFTADVGIKKGERVDYAIMTDGNPVILIECKWAGEPLEKHDSQLFRYFGTSTAKFAILTNGVVYRFYTDLEEPNKMDESPFLEIDMMNLKDTQIPELKKFQKSSFSIDDIFNTASDLKYSHQFRAVFANELQNPSDEFLKFFLNSVYTGVKTQNVMEKFRPVLKKALNVYISELMNDKIKSALNADDAQPSVTVTNDTPVNEDSDTDAETESNSSSKIVTTQDELDAYFAVRMILHDIIPETDIACKDTINYFSVLYQGKVTKWICRFAFNSAHKTLIVPDEEKKEIKYPLESVYDISKFKDSIIESASRYLN